MVNYVDKRNLLLFVNKNNIALINGFKENVFTFIKYDKREDLSKFANYSLLFCYM